MCVWCAVNTFGFCSVYICLLSEVILYGVCIERNFKLSFVERLSSFGGYFVWSVYIEVRLSSFGGYFVWSVYRRELLDCPL